MKKTVLRYGFYSGLAEFVFFVLTWVFIYVTNVDRGIQGYIGYVAIICPLIFIYFGIRYYRDRINDGSITFLKAVQVGLLIVIIPAISFGIVETIYVLYVDPKFYENVMSYDLAQYQKVKTPAEYAIKVKQMKQQLEMDKNPAFNFTIMFSSIAALGTIITLISAVVLQRKAKVVSA